MFLRRKSKKRRTSSEKSTASGDSSRDSFMSDSVFGVENDANLNLPQNSRSKPSSKAGSRQTSRQSSRQSSRQGSRPGSQDLVQSHSPLFNMPAFSSLFSKRQSSSSSLDPCSDIDEKSNSLDRRIHRKKQNSTSIDSFETVNRSNSSLRGRQTDRRRNFRYNSSPELGCMDGHKYVRSSSPNDTSPRRNFGYIAAFKITERHKEFHKYYPSVQHGYLPTRKLSAPSNGVNWDAVVNWDAKMLFDWITLFLEHIHFGEGKLILSIEVIIELIKNGSQ